MQSSCRSIILGHKKLQDDESRFRSPLASESHLIRFQTGRKGVRVCDVRADVMPTEFFMAVGRSFVFAAESNVSSRELKSLNNPRIHLRFLCFMEAILS